MFFARQNRSFFKDIYRKSVFLRYSTYENINVFDINVYDIIAAIHIDFSKIS